MGANEDTIRRGYKAFNEADLGTLTEIFAEDAVHAVPGNNQISGEHEGRDNVLAMYGKIGELTGGNYSAELESVKETGPDTVVAVHRSVGKREAKTIDVRETLVFTLRGGKITRIDESTEDQAAEDDFFA